MIICAYVVESAIASAGSDRRNYQTNKGTDEPNGKSRYSTVAQYCTVRRLELARSLSDTGTTAVIKIRDRFQNSLECLINSETTMNPTMNTILPNSGSDLSELRMMLMQSQLKQQQESMREANNLMLWDQREEFEALKNQQRLNALSLLQAGLKSPAPSTPSINPRDFSSSPALMSQKMRANSFSQLNLSSAPSSAKKASTGGGFPMPRLVTSPQPLKNSMLNLARSMGTGQVQTGASTNQVPLRMPRGSFPLPKVKPAKKSSKKPYSLQAYQKIWLSSNDKITNREIFARRLHRGK